MSAVCTPMATAIKHRKVTDYSRKCRLPIHRPFSRAWGFGAAGFLMPVHPRRSAAGLSRRRYGRRREISAPEVVLPPCGHAVTKRTLVSLHQNTKTKKTKNTQNKKNKKRPNGIRRSGFCAHLSLYTSISASNNIQQRPNLLFFRTSPFWLSAEAHR